LKNCIKLCALAAGVPPPQTSLSLGEFVSYDTPSDLSHLDDFCDSNSQNLLYLSVSVSLDSIVLHRSFIIIVSIIIMKTFLWTSELVQLLHGVPAGQG